MKTKYLTILLLLIFSISFARKRIDYDEYRLTEAFGAYSSNNMLLAKELLEARLKKNHKELPTLTYYAEVCYQLKEYKKADSLASAAIKVDRKNSHAYKIKGTIRNKRYGSNDINNVDTSYMKYYLKGVKRNPKDGNIWVILWLAGMELNDEELTRNSLNSMYEYNYFTETAYNFARLYLSQLPDSAIFITGGDMDTYPLAVLQEVEKFRTDVTIINYSMANQKWYFDYVCKKAGIDHGMSQEEMDSVQFYIDRSKGKVIYKSSQFLSSLITQINKKVVNRPLCGVLSLENKMLPDIYLSHINSKGLFYQYNDTIPSKNENPEELAEMFRSIKPEEFINPLISEYVNSPVLLAASVTIA